MRRVAYIAADGEVVDLSQYAAERLLARDPELEREWERWDAMTGRQGGRLLVLNALRIRATPGCSGEGSA